MTKKERRKVGVKRGPHKPQESQNTRTGTLAAAREEWVDVNAQIG